jgi:TolA-binding protein
MDEGSGRELTDLKREIVETRNQVIKADNQVKNLSLDVKSFERRFEMLERRARLSGLGVNVLVALVIAIAAYMISSVQTRSLTESVAKAEEEAKAAKQTAQQQSEELRRRLAELDDSKRKNVEATSTSKKILDHLDAGREKDAVDLLDKYSPKALSELEARLMEKRVGELRVNAAEDAYEAGKKAAEGNRSDSAVAELTRCLNLDPEGRYSANARYLLASELYQMGRYADAEPHLRGLLKSRDKNVVEEARFMLGASLARLDKRDEAKQLLTDIVNARGVYSSRAKPYLTALEINAETPKSATGGGPAPTAPAATPSPAAAPATPPQGG